MQNLEYFSALEHQYVTHFHILYGHQYMVNACWKYRGVWLAGVWRKRLLNAMMHKIFFLNKKKCKRKRLNLCSKEEHWIELVTTRGRSRKFEGGHLTPPEWESNLPTGVYEIFKNEKWVFPIKKAIFSGKSKHISLFRGLLSLILFNVGAH